MQQIIEEHFTFLQNVRQNQRMMKTLEERNITILTDCEENKELAKRFYAKYYKTQVEKRIALVGMDPNKRGAGKTGVAFLDFKSLSVFLDKVPRETSDASSQFIYGIIQHFGPTAFFQHVYMTNVSWFGFQRHRKAFHYYDLAGWIARLFTKGFIKEMKMLNPSCIVPLGQKAEETLLEMKEDGRLPQDITIAERLPHPYWCSKPQNLERGRQKYIDVIEQFIEEGMVN